MTREQKLEEALIILRDQMQSYQDQHMAKSPPQYGKAAVNAKAVALANEALVYEEVPQQIVDLIDSWASSPAVDAR